MDARVLFGGPYSLIANGKNVSRGFNLVCVPGDQWTVAMDDKCPTASLVGLLGIGTFSLYTVSRWLGEAATNTNLGRR